MASDSRCTVWPSQKWPALIYEVTPMTWTATLVSNTDTILRLYWCIGTKYQLGINNIYQLSILYQRHPLNIDNFVGKSESSIWFSTSSFLQKKHHLCWNLNLLIDFEGFSEYWESDLNLFVGPGLNDAVTSSIIQTLSV